MNTHTQTTLIRLHSHAGLSDWSCGYGTIRYAAPTCTETQNDFYLLQFSSDSHQTRRADSSHHFLHTYITLAIFRHHHAVLLHKETNKSDVHKHTSSSLFQILSHLLPDLQTLGLGSPEHSLSFCTPLPSPLFFLLDLFNLEVEGSTPTSPLFLFVFSSPSRELSPLLRGEGCNRPMVYYYSSSLLYPIALETSLTLQSLNDSFPFLPFLFFLLLSLLRVATSRRLSLPLSLLSRRLVCVLPKVSPSLSFAHASNLLRS
jgi:hypothetical protein